jgi:hypothetical protein
MEVSGWLHVPAALPPAGTSYTGGWVGPRACLDAQEKRLPLSRIELQFIFRRYTDWAIPASVLCTVSLIIEVGHLYMYVVCYVKQVLTRMSLFIFRR